MPSTFVCHTEWMKHTQDIRQVFQGQLFLQCLFQQALLQPWGIIKREKRTKTKLYLSTFFCPLMISMGKRFYFLGIISIILNQDLQSTAKDSCNCFYYCFFYHLIELPRSKQPEFPVRAIWKIRIGCLGSSGTSGAEIPKLKSFWYFSLPYKRTPKSP